MHITVHVSIEPVRIRPRAELLQSPDVGVAIGEAPDGLPLVLQIWRGRDVRSPILGVLGRPEHDLPPEVTSAIDTLQRLVSTQVVRDGIGELEGKQGYTCSRSIGAMLGSSLLANALGEGGPLGAGHARDDGRIAATSAGVVMGRDEIRQMIGAAGSTRRLFVPIPEGRCRVVEVNATTGSPGHDEVRSSRPIVFERLERIPGVRFGYRYRDGAWHTGSFEDPGAYRNVVRQADGVAWWLPKSSLALTLAAAAESLEEVHRRGRVHGDVKPANILLGEEGPVAIDSLEIEAGRVATVCTPSWAAPEQVTVRPVTPATDVYALGLVLARLLGAVVFGEERTFVVPTGGAEKRRMQVLCDPQVFIDPTVGLQLGEEAMKAYASFIARCTAFAPERRPQSGARFGAELRDLLARHPLPTDREAGWCRLGWLAGSLHRSVDLLGAAQPAWVLSDGRRFG